MKKILLFARDPGGANTVLPLINALNKKYDVLLYAKDAALPRFQKEGYSAGSIMEELESITEESVAEWLRDKRPDFVMTGTSADDKTEKYLWKACEKQKLPCFAILDQWMNYGIRFSKYDVSELEEYEKNKLHEYLPDRILVMDSYAREMMCREGIAGERILVTGQPHFERIVDAFGEITNEQEAAYRKRHRIAGDEKIVVYASEPISQVYKENDASYHKLGYTERTNFKAVKKELERLAEQYGQKLRVIIRLHPKENKDNYADLMESSYYVTYETDQETDGRILMKVSSLVIGMSSMFLIEAVLCGRPVISVMLHDTGKASFILAEKGQMETARREDEIREQLERWFQGSWEIIDMKIPGHATERILTEMEAYL